MHGCHAPKVNGVSGKVTIPKFVAERIEANTDNLRGSHVTYQLDLLSNNNKIKDWMANPVNAIDLIKAINNGYEVEVEYLTWDQAYKGMKEGKIYRRYTSNKKELDYYKIENDKLVFANDFNNIHWRVSGSSFNDLIIGHYVLIEKDGVSND